MRYLWDRYDDYFGAGRAGIATRPAMRLLRGPLRRWDRASTDRVSVMIAISEFVRERIRDFYGRDAEIIHPPVDVERFRPVPREGSPGWLVVSAFAPYKRLDVAIRAAELAGVPLTVVGKGPEEAALRRIAGPRARFLGWVPDEELVRLYSSCRGLLFPGIEDFGITPLEAMACGRPVVAYARGGALETVRGASWPGDPGGASSKGTGLLVAEQTPESFAAAIRHLERHPDLVDPAECRRRAERFGREVFRNRIREGLGRWLGGTPGPSGARRPGTRAPERASP
jgi:glycosyltransferase involved in cell wall biosynthesis